ncbi:EmrB/QacA family drug resistance transporter, partial [Mesorhizobium sp. M2D.F.Ca.ET.160.01.1.1]
ALLLLGLPHERSDWGGLLRADWLGILGMTAGLSALTVVLEDGQRERWFESTLIVVLTVVSVVGFALLALSQFTSKTPVIRLNILFQRSFGAVFVMVMAVGMILFGIMYMTP